MVSMYVMASLVTAGVISAANRCTGINMVYTLTSSALWPAWWVTYTFAQES
jgi:hypothetical protein